MNKPNYFGRIVVITGATGGVGQAVTLRWLEASASVLAVSHSSRGEDALRAAWASTPHSEPSQLVIATADVTTEDGAREIVARAEREFGRPPDTLIHLVGGFAMGPLDAPDAPDIWNRMIALNLTSAFHCYRAMLPALRYRSEGWIVGVGSRAAVQPPAQMAAYAASKAGLIALTQSLSAEVRAEGIHVNVILASTLDTPANRADMGEDAAKNWVTPNDLAEATLFLCSPRAQAVHGATLELYANA